MTTPRARHLPTALAAFVVAVVARLEPHVEFISVRKAIILSGSLVVALLAPGIFLLVSLAGAFGLRRITAVGVDASVADAVLVAALLASIPIVRSLSRRTRRVVRADAIFQLLLLVVVLANPTHRAVVEWLHRILLVTGALIVGAALRSTLAYTRAFQLYVGAATAVAADAVRRAMTTGFEPAYPFGMQKNPAALLICFALLLLVAAPRATNIPPTVLRPTVAVLVLGTAATRSRGSILALLVVGFVVLVRSGRVHRALPSAIVVATLMGAVVIATTGAELTSNREVPSAARFHGIGARKETTQIALEAARADPLTGAGLRYWYDPALAAAHPGAVVEPHSLVTATLAEGGAVGAVAILILLVGALSSLKQLDGELVELARAALWMRVIAGLFDIYWVGGTGSLPWVLIGVALAGSAESTDDITLTAVGDSRSRPD